MSRSLYDQNFRVAKVLTGPGDDTCLQQLDWPFEAGPMRDGVMVSFPPPPCCVFFWGGLIQSTTVFGLIQSTTVFGTNSKHNSFLD